MAQVGNSQAAVVLVSQDLRYRGSDPAIQEAIARGDYARAYALDAKRRQGGPT